MLAILSRRAVRALWLNVCASAQLRFRITQNAAPMKEMNPFGEVDAPHLHGYFVSKVGQFRLIRLAGNRTMLEGTSWYQHGMWPAQYWRWWSDAIVHRVHSRVLRHIQVLSEAR